MMSPEYWSAPNHESMFARDASVVGVEQFPRKHIDVVVNHDAEDLLPEQFKFLASPDFLATSCYVTVPKTIETPKKVLVSHAWRRALPVGYGLIPYTDHIIGTTVMTKGGWLSGSAIQNMELYVDRGHDPWGLFGNRDAQIDTRVSSFLIEKGFRSALGLGYVVFNEKALREMLLDRWKDNRKAAKIISNGLDLVKDDGQVPAQLFRLTGVSERARPDYDVPVVDSTNVAFEAARAARSLIAHAEWFPKHFVTWLKSKDSLVPTLSALGRISHRLKLSFEELGRISDLGLGILLENSRTVRAIVDFIPPRFGHSKIDIKSLTWGKDLSMLDYIFQDYEQVFNTVNPTQVEKASEDYLMSVGGAHSAHMKKLLGIFVDNSQLGPNAVVPYYETTNVSRLIKQRRSEK